MAAGQSNFSARQKLPNHDSGWFSSQNGDDCQPTDSLAGSLLETLHFPWQERLLGCTDTKCEEFMTVVCRGVRGATTVEENTRDAILLATRQMLALMIRRNGIESTEVASAIFTVTKDLDAEFPALAARQLGWLEVPLLCGYEISVSGSLQSCIRVLLHWNTDKSQQDVQHVYIHDAVRLRPDLCELPPVDWEELENWIGDNLS